jgi:hypothetical protein
MRFLFLIPLLFSFVLFSQDNTKSIFTLKPSLGLNACQVHGDRYNGFNKLGVFAGIAVNAQFKNKSSIDIGFYFSQKGAKHNPVPAKGDYAYYKLNLNYIDLPVLFHFQVNPVYFITIGPSIGYLINYNENINYVDFTGAYKFNKFDAGINLGLGRKILKDKFFVEVRSSNSYLSIRDYGQIANQVFFPNTAAKFFNKGFYNIILTLMFSYNIDFKKKSETQQP